HRPLNSREWVCAGGDRWRGSLGRRLDRAACRRGHAAGSICKTAICATDQAPDGGGQEIEDDERGKSPGREAVPACGRFLRLAREAACRKTAGERGNDPGYQQPYAGTD